MLNNVKNNVLTPDFKEFCNLKNSVFFKADVIKLMHQRLKKPSTEQQQKILPTSN